MASSVVEIANLALSRLGELSIISLDDPESNQARQVKIAWPQIRDEVLASHRWNEATARENLSRLSEKPAWGWEWQFQLPADFLRLCELNGDDVWGRVDRLELEGGRLLTDQAEARILYIRRVESPVMFGPLLTEALTVALAAALAVPLTGSSNRRNELLQEYEARSLSRARVIDAQQTRSGENHPLIQMLRDSAFLSRRFY